MPVTRYDTVPRLEALLEIFHGSSGRRLQRAKLLARDKIVQFEAVLELSVNLRLITINERTDAFTLRIHSTGWIQTLPTLALQSKGGFKLALLNLLRRFSFNGSLFTYALRTDDPNIDSSARNFALEIGLLDYDSTTGQYCIPPVHVEDFLRFLSTHTAPSMVEESVADKLRVGTAAELAVIDFEVESLSKFREFSLPVVHDALTNAGAGYDISSWEPAIQTIPVTFMKKFIEVKAVSAKDCLFYWSGNETEWAKRLGSQYYLYLVPVVSKNRFDLQAIEVIQNPYQHFFNRSNSWQQKVEVYSFKKGGESSD